MAEINAEIASRAASRDVELALRVGINTGEVLAGRVGEAYTVIGDAVNLAARLQAAARPGTVTVGPMTRRLTASSIAYRDLEPLDLKGKSEPIPAWEATGAAATTGSVDQHRLSVADDRARGRARASPLAVRACTARGARPCLVTIFGQAGVGKSRLLSELASALADDDTSVPTLIGRSPAYGTSTTYAALAEIVRDRFGGPGDGRAGRGDGAAARRDRRAERRRRGCRGDSTRRRSHRAPARSRGRGPSRPRSSSRRESGIGSSRRCARCSSR